MCGQPYLSLCSLPIVGLFGSNYSQINFFTDFSSFTEEVQTINIYLTSSWSFAIFVGKMHQ